MLHQMGPLLKAALAFWTHVGLEEGLGARSHTCCEGERQRVENKILEQLRGWLDNGRTTICPDTNSV